MTALQWVKQSSGYQIGNCVNWQENWRQFPRVLTTNLMLAQKAFTDLERDLLFLESQEGLSAFFATDANFQSYFIDVVETISRTAMKAGLMQHATGFLYRLCNDRSIFESQVSLRPRTVAEVEQKILKFKKDIKKHVLRSGECIELTEQDKTVAQAIADHTKFTNLLFSDNCLMKNCFNWCIRDGQDFKIFLYFPGLTKEIQDAALSRKTNALFKGMIELSEEKQERVLQFTIQRQNYKSPTTIKKVTIPIATSIHDITPKRIDLLMREQQIKFDDQSSIKVQDIIPDFKNRKETGQGRLEVINGALTPWGNDGEFRFFNQTNTTTTKNWWYVQPYKKMSLEEVKATILESVSKKEDKEIILKHLNEATAIRRAVVTIGTMEPTALENHALVEIFVCIDKDCWGFYPFGFYPKQFPKNFLQAIPFLAIGQPGIIRYPAPAGVLGGYEQFYYTQLVTKTRAERTLDRIGQSIAATKSGLLNISWLNKRFHVRAQNCAHWVEEILSDEGDSLPDVFSISPEDIEPTNRVNRLAFEAFDELVWPPLLAYTRKLGEDPSLPIGLAHRAIYDETFKDFQNLTIQDK